MDYSCQQYDYNVIIASWSRGAIKIDYTQAASNTRVAGAEIGYVARHLVERGVANRNDTWCTGHSLGSHVCGHAGQNYKFGRVTGVIFFLTLFFIEKISSIIYRRAWYIFYSHIYVNWVTINSRLGQPAVFCQSNL